MKDFKEKREELIKTKDELIKRGELLNREYQQIRANVNAVEGALMLLDELETESKNVNEETFTVSDSTQEYTGKLKKNTNK